MGVLSITGKSFIVTGANGFIGRNLIRRLSTEGATVWAVDRSHEGSPIAELPGVYPVTCPLDNLRDLPSLIPVGEYTAFYHFAWAGTTGAARSDYALQALNAVGTCDAARAAKSLGCGRFLTTGTVTEHVAEQALGRGYTAQNLIYGISKQYAHGLLDVVARNEEINYVWAQLSNIFGGDNTNGNLISYTLGCFGRVEVPTFGPCEQPYNFTYISDVIEALVGLGTASSLTRSSYFVSNGECRPLKEYLRTAANLCNAEVAIGARPDDGVRYEKSWFEDAGLWEEIGAEPRYSFERGLEEILHTDGGDK